jgi:hypothetical protein
MGVNCGQRGAGTTHKRTLTNNFGNRDFGHPFIFYFTATSVNTGPTGTPQQIFEALCHD